MELIRRDSVNGKPLNWGKAGALALAACLVTLPLAAQQDSSGQLPSDQPPAAIEQQQSPDNSTQGFQPFQQQDARQNAPTPTVNAVVPQTLTLPSGTVIPVRIDGWLSSGKNHAGDTFSAVLEQPLVADGWVVARRGQTVIGRVDVAEKVKGVSHLGIDLSELVLVDGRQMPLTTQLVQASTGPSNDPGRDIAIAGTTTTLGTIIGAAVGGGQGAAIGAGAGLAAGIAGILATQGKPTVIPPESLLTFRLDSPLAISTERSQVAFHPVAASDYNRDADAYAGYASRRSVNGPGYPRPAPYYYSGGCYPGGWGCYSPYPYWGPAYFGVYGRFGLGPRVIVGRGFRR